MRQRATLVWACSVCALLAMHPAAQADTPASIDYVVKPGDDCVSIAAEQLGDRARYRVVHQYNPNLGPLPHNLKPGSVMKLPKRDRAADATLTAARGAVEVRRPAEMVWDAAKRGMDLFRAWRVGARAFSSAEVTFRDNSRLFMRENTIVIIYGDTTKRSTPVDAELETGALETRLAALSRRSVVVRTASAQTALPAGNALVSVDRTSATVVANHGGKPATVRAVDAKQRPRGTPVRVAAGMGSKVKRGELPSKPRPLPSPPTWQTSASEFIALDGVGGTMRAAWSAIPAVAGYHLVVRTADGNDVAAAEVAAPAASVELHRLPPGRYAATIAAIDRDGFESVPSPPFAFEVTAVAVFPPGSREPLAAPNAQAGEAGFDPTTASPPYSLATGSRIVAASGMTCSVGKPPAVELVVDDVAAMSLRCERNGTALPPVPIRVVGACVGAACIAGPPKIAPRPPARAPEPPPRHRDLLELGAYGGYWLVPGAPSLGKPQDVDHAIANGPVAGLRATALYRGAIGAELEVFAARTDFAAAPGTATIAGWRGHLVGALDHGRLGVRLVVGGGTSSLVRTSGSAARDTSGVFDIGLAATLDISGGWLLRLDAREDTVTSATGRTNIHEFYGGVAHRFSL